MTETDPRRATEEEIRTARAWVDETLPALTRDSDTERQTEYVHALEILIFANGGRYSQPKVNDATAGLVPLADVLDALEEEGRLAAWRLTPDAADVYSRAMTMLAERFAPTAPSGADERTGHG